MDFGTVSRCLLIMIHVCSCFQNAELLSSLDSASVRIFKPHSFSALSAVPRFQSSTPPAPLTAGSLTSPASGVLAGIEPPRMDTIQEDPSYDSRLDEQILEEDFNTRTNAARSFADLTDATEDDLERSFKMKAHGHRSRKETEC